MDGDRQLSFTDVEYGNRRRASRRERFLESMDQVIPWDQWVRLIQPYYYRGQRGRKPKPIETMLRMYLLRVWFSLSDEGVEEAIYDSHAMRRFMGLDFAVEQVPDATTLLHSRHLLEKHNLGEQMFAEQNRIFDAQGWVMRVGSIVDATIIAAPSSTKNATGNLALTRRQRTEVHRVHDGRVAAGVILLPIPRGVNESRLEVEQVRGGHPPIEPVPAVATRLRSQRFLTRGRQDAPLLTEVHLQCEPRVVGDAAPRDLDQFRFHRASPASSEASTITTSPSDR